MASNQLADQHNTSQNLFEQMATDGNQEENHADEFDELNLQLTKYIGGPATLGTTKKTPPPPDDDGVIQAELQKLKKSYLVLTDLIDKGKSHL